MIVDSNTSQPLKKYNSHEWVHNDNLDDLNTLKWFVNWLSEEFVLFLQDDVDLLTVFFPNGYFVVKELELTNKTHVEFQIEVNSKCLKNGTKIFKQVMTVLNHFKNFSNTN